MNTQTQNPTTTVDFKVITVSELADILCNITKSTIINITYLVDDNRSKVVKGIKQVQKMVNVANVYLNHDYTKKVINLTGNENFVAQELKGMIRISSTLLRTIKTNEPVLDGKVLYSECVDVQALYHNGKEITREESEAMDLWTPSYYNPTEKTTMGRGSVSVEDDFYIVKPYLKRIIRAKIQGEVYIIKG